MAKLEDVRVQGLAGEKGAVVGAAFDEKREGEIIGADVRGEHSGVERDRAVERGVGRREAVGVGPD